VWPPGSTARPDRQSALMMKPSLGIAASSCGSLRARVAPSSLRVIDTWMALAPTVTLARAATASAQTD